MRSVQGSSSLARPNVLSQLVWSMAADEYAGNPTFLAKANGVSIRRDPRVG